VNSCAVINVRRFCCTRGTHRVTVQSQDWKRLSELMCCDKILSLNSDTMCAPSAAETSYLYHSTWVHSALFNFVLIEQGWVNSCAVIKVRRFCCTRGTHLSSLSLVQSCLWTVPRWVPLVQQKRLPFITAHEFTQPCSILFCCTRGTNRVTVQRQDWTRLSELMGSHKGKKFLLH
jgi:hypothetical protein